MDKRDLYEIVPEISEKSESAKKKTKKKMTRKKKKAIIISVVSSVSALVLIAGAVLGIFLYKKYNKKTYTIEDMPFLYITADETFKYYDPVTQKVEIISSALHGRNTDSPYTVHEVTKDGTAVYFVDDMGDLYRRPLVSGKINKFISEYVKGFKSDENGNIVFLTEEGVLRFCEFNAEDDGYNFTDIDTAVQSFWYAEDAKHVVYTKASETGVDLYVKNFGLFGKTELIANDCGEIVNYDKETLKDIYLVKSDEKGKKTVSYVKNFKAPKTIVNSADEIYSYGENGSVIYGSRTGIFADLSSYFTDSLLEEDETVEEPDYGELLYGNITSAQFEAAAKKWGEKIGRDVIREFLKEESKKTETFELYKSENGKIKKLDGDVTKVVEISADHSVVLYVTAKYKSNSSEARGDISEFESVSAAQNAVLSILKEGNPTYKVSMDGVENAKMVYRPEKETSMAFMREDATGVYVYEKSPIEETGSLKYIDIALGNIGTPKEISAVLSEEPTVKNGQIIINEKVEEKNTTYFVEGIAKTLIDDNVTAKSVVKNNNGSLLYIKDAKEGIGTLIFKPVSSEAITLSENAIEAHYRADNEIYFTTTIRARGYILNVYNGETSKAVDEELISIIAFE